MGDQFQQLLVRHAQDPASVVLVSFGSEYFMSEQQLARGLELSRERFALCGWCGSSSVLAALAAGVPIVALSRGGDRRATRSGAAAEWATRTITWAAHSWSIG
jgi:hypothetical protein